MKTRLLRAILLALFGSLSLQASIGYKFINPANSPEIQAAQTLAARTMQYARDLQRLPSHYSTLEVDNSFKEYLNSSTQQVDFETKCFEVRVRDSYGFDRTKVTYTSSSFTFISYIHFEFEVRGLSPQLQSHIVSVLSTLYRLGIAARAIITILVKKATQNNIVEGSSQPYSTSSPFMPTDSGSLGGNSGPATPPNFMRGGGSTVTDKKSKKAGAKTKKELTTQLNQEEKEKKKVEDHKSAGETPVPEMKPLKVAHSYFTKNILLGAFATLAFAGIMWKITYASGKKSSALRNSK